MDVPVKRKWSRQKIFWMNTLYTKEDFLRIMRNENPDIVYWRMKGDVGVPQGKLKKDDIDGWIALAGATWTP
jgi:hypothetical protein